MIHILGSLEKKHRRSIFQTGEIVLIRKTQSGTISQRITTRLHGSAMNIRIF